MNDYLFKKLEELEYRIVQLENQNKGLVWEEVEEMPKPKEDDKLFEIME